MLRISKWIAVALLLAAPALAEDRFVKTISNSVTYQGGHVLIEHGFGGVTVRTTTNDTVTARGTVRTSDAELGKQVRFAVSNGPNGVSIRTIYPAIHIHGENVSYSVDLDVTVPERAPLRLRNRFGSVEVEGLRAPADIINQQGPVSVRDIRGGRVENGFGPISLEGSAGDTTVQNANGPIQITDIQGQLTVTNRFGPITVHRVDKGAAISNSNGPVVVADVKGTLSVSDSFGSIEARNIGGPTAIADVNGNITALNIGGDLDIDTRFGLVKVEKIHGKLTVDNANGGVTAGDINGSAHVHTSFASVFLKGIDGDVDVENQNGAISVAGLRGGCNAVSLRTTYSPIKISVGSDANYAVDARTSFGSINADVPITVTRKSENSMAGNIGNGKCRMELVTSMAGITLTRE